MRVHAERGYDREHGRRLLLRRRICPQIDKRRIEHGPHLGVTCWVVERTLVWLHQLRRLRMRYGRRADLHEGLRRRDCAITCRRTAHNAWHDPFPFPFCWAFQFCSRPHFSESIIPTIFLPRTSGIPLLQAVPWSKENLGIRHTLHCVKKLAVPAFQRLRPPLLSRGHDPWR